jgi:hypothetical protein
MRSISDSVLSNQNFRAVKASLVRLEVALSRLVYPLEHFFVFPLDLWSNFVTSSRLRVASFSFQSGTYKPRTLMFLLSRKFRLSRSQLHALSTFGWTHSQFLKNGRPGSETIPPKM